MPNIFFKKNTDEILRLTDSVFRYELHHKYFSWTESEIPYDSRLFFTWIKCGVIDVINMDDDFDLTKFNFKEYLKYDKVIEDNKILEVQERKKVQEKNEKKLKQKQLKEKKKKDKEIKKKVEEKKNKEKVIIIGEDEITNKLNKPIIKNDTSSGNR